MDQLLTLGAQSTLVLATAGFFTTLLRRGSAAQRHCVWTVAFGLLALLLAWPEPAWTWRRDQVALPASAALERMVIDVSAGEASFRWARTMELLWAGVASLLLLRLTASQWRLHQMRRRAEAGPESIDYSPEVAGPLVMGFWRPTILLPQSARAWDEERLRVVLLHEHQHVERRDLWWMMLGQTVSALFWPQPLVWFALWAERKESEQACDDAVVAAGIKGSCYANHLVAIAASQAASSLAMRGSILKGGLEMAQQSELEQRLRALLNPMVSRAAVGKASAAFAVLTGAVLLAPVAGWKVVAQPAKPTLGIHGVVADSSGAVVPNARVTVVFAPPSGHLGALNITRREIVRSDAAGEFRLPSVPGGSYTVQVESPGFARLEQTGVAIEGGKVAELRLVLNVGGLRENLQVSAHPSSGSAPPPPPPPPGVREALASGAAMAAGQMAGEPVKIRVGGNVMAAKLESKTIPFYPPDCKAERVQGTVLLRALIGKEGTVLDLQPVNEFVDARLRESATTAVKQWRYRPTLLNGLPVDVVTEIEVNFTLLP